MIAMVAILAMIAMVAMMASIAAAGRPDAKTRMILCAEDVSPVNGNRKNDQVLCMVLVKMAHIGVKILEDMS